MTVRYFLTILFSLILLFSSCSKKEKVGFYDHQNQTESKTPPKQSGGDDKNDDRDLILPDNREVEDKPPAMKVEVLEGDLFDLWDRFFKTFVKVVSKDKKPFQTKVDYKTIHQLTLKNNQKLANLIYSIRYKTKAWKAEGKNKRELLAFYFNVYNFEVASVIGRNLVFEGQTINTIRDLSRGIFPNEIYLRKSIKLGKEEFGIDHIREKKILPLMSKGDKVDARFFFALHCGAVSCPPLLNKAYRPENVEKLMDKMTYESLRSSRMATNKKKNGYTYFSSFLKNNRKLIIKDPKSAYRNSKNSLANYIKRWVPSRTIHKNIRFMKFDWSLEVFKGQGNTIPEDFREERSDISEDVSNGGESRTDRYQPQSDICQRYENLYPDIRAVAVCDHIIEGIQSGFIMGYRQEVLKAEICLYEKTKGRKTYLGVHGLLTENSRRRSGQSVYELSASGKKKQSGHTISFKRMKRVNTTVKFNQEDKSLHLKQISLFGVPIRKTLIQCQEL